MCDERIRRGVWLHAISTSLRFPECHSPGIQPVPSHVTDARPQLTGLAPGGRPDQARSLPRTLVAKSLERSYSPPSSRKRLRLRLISRRYQRRRRRHRRPSPPHGVSARCRPMNNNGETGSGGECPGRYVSPAPVHMLVSGFTCLSLVNASVFSPECFFSCDSCAARIRRSFDDDSVATLVHGFVADRVDYCVGLLVGSLATEDDSQAATCSQRSRVKLRQVRPRTDSFPAPCSTLVRRR